MAMARSQVNGVAIPYGAPVRHLRELALSTCPERWAAFAALSHSTDAEALDVLVEACDAPDEYVRRAGVEGIGQHSLGRHAAAVVLRMLQDASDVVTRSACAAAAGLGIGEARDALHRLRCASSPSTREEAVRALAFVWQEDDFEAMLSQSQTDSSPRVRREAAWTLRRSVAEVHAARLFASWQRHPLPRHRVWACELAAAHPDRSFQADLKVLAEDPDGHVRSKARRVLDVLDDAG
jgi:hypothetical protein